MKNNIVKYALFIILIIVLCIIVFFSVFGSKLSFISSDSIKYNKEEKNELLDDISVNLIDLVYSKDLDLYFLSLDSSYENSKYILKLNLEDGYKYKVQGQFTNIITVDYSKVINVIIYNDEFYDEIKIQITNLPIININVEDVVTKENESKAEFSYVSSNFSTDSNIMIKYRGDKSLLFDKKSYKITGYNKDYSNDISLDIPSFYNGSGYILDAVYRDPSKIRNALSTEIWNQVSSDFTDVKINSEFVELIVNNEYRGLYVLTEPINRKKLGLNKTTEDDTSIIVKSISYEFEPLAYYKSKDIKNIQSSIFEPFEIKYPNDEELYSYSWNKFLKVALKYYDNIYYQTDNDIINTFDINNYVDWVLFNSFTDNEDNKLLKNNYFYMKSSNDKIIYIQPWDMEYSYGIRYDEDLLNSVSYEYDEYATSFIKFNNESAPLVTKMTINRYIELRKNILTSDNINSIIDKYSNELNKGASLRDSNKWYSYNQEEEANRIKNWVNNRFGAFDDYIMGLYYE